MSERKRSDKKNKGKKLNKGGERGGNGFSGKRKNKKW